MSSIHLEDTQSGIKKLFEERKKFIIIGLTGRTGSGCTTTAGLLEKKWEGLQAPTPKTDDFSSNNERKYRIVFNFAKVNWKQFKVIKIKDVITSFIIEKRFDEFKTYLQNCFPDQDCTNIDNIKECYDSHHKRMNQFKKYFTNDQQLDDNNDELSSEFSEALRFYFDDIPSFSDNLKNSLRRITKNTHTRLYQIIGDNIRSSGEALKEEFSASNIFSIAYRTNKIIKMLRHSSKEPLNTTFVVIDTIRNPFEATFFRDRYSSFYMIAINVENEYRIRRLQKAFDYSPSEIKEIDKKEYEDKPKGNLLFISQNISKCVEISDIYFHNPQVGETDFNPLKKQLIWYISLIMHPGLVTPTAYEGAMQIAYSAKLNSGCISRQVGAIITDECLSVKAVGWNNTPEGQVPCLMRNALDLNNHHDKQAYSDYEDNDERFRNKLSEVLIAKINGCQSNPEILQGRNIPFCFKDVRNSLDEEKNQVHTRSLHAEENAFMQISKYGGQAVKNGKLFTTASPCELCAKKAYQLNIQEIVYIDPYPGIANNHILSVGNKRPTLTLFSGAIGRAYHQLYQSILPYKDESQMLLGFEWPNKDIKNETERLNKEKERLEKENEELKKRIQELTKAARPTSTTPPTPSPRSSR